MQAEIITIGDEILIGQIVDTNSAWLGEKLNAAGIRIHRITSVSDTARHIEQAVGEALKRSDVVICTGGLGPTKDDITKHTLARMFGMALVRDEAVYEQVRRMTELRHIDFNELNQAQALVPEGCVVLPNRCGTAPGMWFERDGRVLVSLPGVPFEMKALVDEQMLPRLCEHFRFRAIVHRTAITFGMAESILAETIAGWESALPGYLHLAYLPSALCIRLRLSAYEIDREEAEREIGRQFEQLERIIPYGIVGYGDASLESITGDLLRARGATVATAESCTGPPLHGPARHLGLLSGRRGSILERREALIARRKRGRSGALRSRQPSRRRANGRGRPPGDRLRVRHRHDRRRRAFGRHARQAGRHGLDGRIGPRGHLLAPDDVRIAAQPEHRAGLVARDQPAPPSPVRSARSRTRYDSVLKARAAKVQRSGRTVRHRIRAREVTRQGCAAFSKLSPVPPPPDGSPRNPNSADLSACAVRTERSSVYGFGRSNRKPTCSRGRCMPVRACCCKSS